MASAKQFEFDQPTIGLAPMVKNQPAYEEHAAKTPRKQTPRGVLYLAHDVESETNGTISRSRNLHVTPRRYGLILKNRKLVAYFDAKEVYDLYVTGRLPSNTFLVQAGYSGKVEVSRFVRWYLRRTQLFSLSAQPLSIRKQSLSKRMLLKLDQMSLTAVLCSLSILVNVVSVGAVILMR